MEYVLGLYYVLNLKYSHGDSVRNHCWLLDMLGKVARIGSSMKFDEKKLDCFKKLFGDCALRFDAEPQL